MAMTDAQRCLAILIGSVLFVGPACSRNIDTPMEASSFAQGATYAACFIPGQDCTGLIVEDIGHARRQIRVQAYSFTSVPIAEALIEAARRGIDVKTILDKSHRSERHTAATLLANAGIPVAIDDHVAIAHNKVIIIDGDTVITGSFNFTKAAQDLNAENILVIHGDRGLAKLYIANWQSRWQLSAPYR
jgi:phosphatidylserine/phosphatidylglycerophosphate/cardiolipin synthase-like enzyme